VAAPVAGEATALIRIEYMRSRTLSVLASVAVLTILASSCAPDSSQTRSQNQNDPDVGSVDQSEEYHATGVIITLLPDGKHVKIDHGTIDGFMEAMTMSFEVEDPSTYTPTL